MEFRDYAKQEAATFVERLVKSADEMRSELEARLAAVDADLDAALEAHQRVDAQRIAAEAARAKDAAALAKSEKARVRAEEELASARAALSKLQSARDEAHERVQLLEARLAEADADLDALRAEFAAERKSLHDEAKALRTQLDAARAEQLALQDQIDALRPETMLLERELSALRAESVGRERELETLRTDASALREENEALLAEDVALRQENEALHATAAALRQETETLQITAATLREEAETLQTTAAAFRQETVTLQTSAESLRAENETLQTTADLLREENESLRASAASLREENEALLAEDVALRQENEALRGQATAIAEDHGTLCAQIETLRRGEEVAASVLTTALCAVETLGAATDVSMLFAAVVKATARELPRVALFRTKGNHLEGEHVAGTSDVGNMKKLIIPMTVDSVITRAVTHGALETAEGDELGKTRSPFGTSPVSALATPIRLDDGDALAVLYAESDGPAHPAHATFATLLVRHAEVLLAKLTRELKTIKELQEYASMLLQEAEQMFLADLEGGAPERDCVRRLHDAIECGRQLYAQRAALEGPTAADLFDEQITATIRASDSRFAKAVESAVALPAQRTAS